MESAIFASLLTQIKLATYQVLHHLVNKNYLQQLFTSNTYLTYDHVPYFDFKHISIFITCNLDPTRWCPPVISWFIIPMTIEITAITLVVVLINQLS